MGSAPVYFHRTSTSRLSTTHDACRSDLRCTVRQRLELVSIRRWLCCSSVEYKLTPPHSVSLRPSSSFCLKQKLLFLLLQVDLESLDTTTMRFALPVSSILLVASVANGAAVDLDRRADFSAISSAIAAVTSAAGSVAAAATSAAPSALSQATAAGASLCTFRHEVEN
jgi:hypothetical protein